MVIGLREVVGIVKCALVITSANDLFDDSTSNRRSSVVVMTEVIFSKTENDWKSKYGFFVVSESKCTLPTVVVCTAISLGPDISEISCIFMFGVWRSMLIASFRVPTASSVFAMVGEVIIFMDSNSMGTGRPDAFQFSNNLNTLFVVSIVNAFLFKIEVTVDKRVVGIGHVSSSAGWSFFVLS